MRRRLTKLISPVLTERKGTQEEKETTTIARSAPVVASPKVQDDTEDRLNRVFDGLCGGQKDACSLGGNGVMALLQSLGVGETDVSMLVFLYKCECASLLDVSREEFAKGMKGLAVLDLPGLKAKLCLASDQILDDPKEFTEFFKYVFQACREGTIKTIPKESALFLLPICLSASGPTYTRYLADFCKFLESQKDMKNIKNDEWMSFLSFSLQVENVKEYDFGGHWPLMIDSFVEWKIAQ